MMRVLVLFLFFVPVFCRAADLSLIAGGWSHHFVPAAARANLNQNQKTFGLEFTSETWNLQVSHMRDSFDCASNEAALSRRWPFLSSNYVTAGLTLGVVAAHRCTDQRVVHVNTTYVLVPVGSSNFIGPDLLSISSGHYAKCHPATTFPICTIFQLQTKQVISFTQAPSWVFGVIPGAYMRFGRNVRAEVSLIRSPWAGHHFVLYGQISFVIWRF